MGWPNMAAKKKASAKPQASNSKNAVAHVNHSVWVAASDKSADAGAFEKRLWEAADQFRANSGLKSQEYSAPVLGLIFLRFAEVRFAVQRVKLELPSTSGRGAGGEGSVRARCSRRAWGCRRAARRGRPPPPARPILARRQR